MEQHGLRLSRQARTRLMLVCLAGLAGPLSPFLKAKALNNPCFKQGIGIALAVATWQSLDLCVTVCVTKLYWARLAQSEALIGGPLFALMDIPDDPGLPLLAAWKT